MEINMQKLTVFLCSLLFSFSTLAVDLEINIPKAKCKHRELVESVMSFNYKAVERFAKNHDISKYVNLPIEGKCFDDLSLQIFYRYNYKYKEGMWVNRNSFLRAYGADNSHYKFISQDLGGIVLFGMQQGIGRIQRLFRRRLVTKTITPDEFYKMFNFLKQNGLEIKNKNYLSNYYSFGRNSTAFIYKLIELGVNTNDESLLRNAMRDNADLAEALFRGNYISDYPGSIYGRIYRNFAKPELRLKLTQIALDKGEKFGPYPHFNFYSSTINSVDQLKLLVKAGLHLNSNFFLANPELRSTDKALYDLALEVAIKQASVTKDPQLYAWLENVQEIEILQQAGINIADIDGTQLHFLLKAGKFKIFEQLIKGGAKIKPSSDLYKLNLEQFELALNSGFDLNQQLPLNYGNQYNLFQGLVLYGCTYMDCEKDYKGYLKLIDAMIAKGADLNDVSLYRYVGDSFQMKKELFDYLISKGAKPAEVDLRSDSCTKERIQSMLDQGFYGILVDDYWNKMQLSGCFTEHLEMLKNYKSKKAEGIVHGYATSVKTGYFTKLLDLGFDINQQDDSGNSPLHIALERNSTGVIWELLNLKADITLKNKKGQTALHLAILHGENELIKGLIETFNANVVTVDREKNAAIHLALLKQDEALVQLLYKLPNNKFGRNILMQMILNLHNEFSLKLIHPLFPVNEQDLEGKTALIHAVQMKNYKVVEKLLEGQADTRIKDDNERTARDYAQIMQDPEMIKLLQFEVE